ncbi:hypothetical protein [Haloactinospora alba]|nr:hypothetical protein [Haloactinospora alba]
MGSGSRALGVAAVLAFGLVSACDTGGAGGADDGPGEEGAGPSGLVLLHRGYAGGDPREEQRLVFHDPDTGEERTAVDLPDGAVDPMAPRLPVHRQFSADWSYFAYSTPDTPAVRVAALTEDGSAYETTAELDPPQGEEWSAPRIHGDRLWFAAQATQQSSGPDLPGGNQAGRTATAMSVELEDADGQPQEEGELPLNDAGRPDGWGVGPDEQLSTSRDEQTVNGTSGTLRYRQRGDTVLGATLSSGQDELRRLRVAPVWGENTVILAPRAESGGQSSGSGGGARAVTVDGSADSFEETTVFTPEEGRVRQYAPSPERDLLLVQDDAAWYAVDVDDPGGGSGEKRFDAPRDASMEGYPLVAGWA